MQIIGEKINGTLKQVGRAVAERDADFIQTLARRQVDAGADLLDINAGTGPNQEPDDLVWLVKTVQDTVDVPLSLDSANPRALAAAMGEARQTPLINSISGERKRLEGILPLARAHGCPVIALALDDRGIPQGVEERLAVIRLLINETRHAGLPDEKIYVDPLVMAIATNTQSGLIALKTIRAARNEFPAIHLSIGLSNISFGLPARSLINRTFLILALAAGLDTAILDPLDRDLREALLAAELVLGQDRYCLSYTRAYRAGQIGRTAGDGADK